MNQKGAGSFFFLLGENSGIHQEAKQTNRYGPSDRAGPQAPSANKDLTVGPGPERPAFYFYTQSTGLSFGLYPEYSDNEEVGTVRA